MGWWHKKSICTHDRSIDRTMDRPTDRLLIKSAVGKSSSWLPLSSLPWPWRLNPFCQPCMRIDAGRQPASQLYVYIVRLSFGNRHAIYLTAYYGAVLKKAAAAAAAWCTYKPRVQIVVGHFLLYISFSFFSSQTNNRYVGLRQALNPTYKAWVRPYT